MNSFVKIFFQKIIYTISILWGIVTLIFIVFNILPGDPARMALGQRSDSASLAMIRNDLGLDKPVGIRYLKYLNDLSPLSIHSKNSNSFFYYNTNSYTHALVILNIKQYQILLKAPYLRRSYINHRKVTEMIGQALLPTFILAIVSIVFASIVGIGFGIISALKKDTWIDKTLLTLASLGISVPSFFAAIIVVWLFAYVLGEITQLPITGSLFEIDDLGNERYVNLRNIVLPAITLGIRPLAVVTQLTRNSLLEVLSMDYITTARSKGLTERQIIFRHALRNALNPVVTSISSWFASMMAGVVFIEYIFSWKGIGYLLVTALQDFDLPVVMGSVLFIAIIFLIVNFLTDITYAILDPKIRYQQ